MNDDPTTFSTVMGMVMHAEAERARQEERAAVVAYLRSQRAEFMSEQRGISAYVIQCVAEAIECGDHRREEGA